jgi:glycosyltransferase involved in cell wall biosynthesis
MRRGSEPVIANIEGIPVYRMIRGIERGAVFGLSYLLTSVGAMLRLRPHVEVLHAHHLYLDAVAAVMVGTLVGAPTVTKVACGGAVGDMARLGRTGGGRMLLRMLRGLDRVVVPSHQTEAEVLAAGFAANRVIRIPNGVDTTRFAPGDTIRSDRGRRTVLFLGRLDAQKGVETLLAAWGEVAARLPEAVLLIGGQGPQEGALRALTAQYGLADRVRFLGPVPDPEAYLRAAAAFVLPSWYEGMPNALLEAMSTGLPCIATTIGGTLDVAADEREALLVPPGDAVALAKALLRILMDGDLAGRLGAAARRRIVAEFSLDDVVARYEQLYREMRDGT